MNIEEYNILINNCITESKKLNVQWIPENKFVSVNGIECNYDFMIKEFGTTDELICISPTEIRVFNHKLKQPFDINLSNINEYKKYFIDFNKWISYSIAIDPDIVSR